MQNQGCVFAGLHDGVGESLESRGTHTTECACMLSALWLVRICVDSSSRQGGRVVKAWGESARRERLQADSSEIFELLAEDDSCDLVKHACKPIVLQNCAAAPGEIRLDLSTCKE